ncbi:hypothetical protein MUK42_18864 [Musa troglodytarum]|uniref:DOG1 domain-containing protein n=1 Tax=Musa troglodytarum TaxID=320322 RepID=A0A9E7EWU5_9LILI|nr:hypothetical protein MUK42_18864 [Musa troglodytarum]
MIGWNGPFGSGISRERDHWSYARTCSGLEVFGAKRVEFGLVLEGKRVWQMLVEAPKSVIERHIRMVREGEEEAWMATHRIGETGLSDSGPSTRSVSYGVHGTSLAASNFFDQEGAAYFGELEALMQGVDGIRETEDRKSLFGPRPATLEIFPSWPMRFQQTPRVRPCPDFGFWCGKKYKDESKGRTGDDDDDDDDDDKRCVHDRNNANSSTIIPRQDTKAPSSKSRGSKKEPTKEKGAPFKSPRKTKPGFDAYVQQLESRRLRLKQLEQELQRARSQGLFLGVAGNTNEAISPGAAMFDTEHGRWLDENCRLMSELRGALQAHLPEASLRVIVDQCIMNYDELFQLKAEVAKSDVFHLLSGSWTTPSERCFLWMGGFRPSELLQILIPQLDPSTEQQLIYNLKQSSQQAEEALSQGLEQLHQSLADTVAGGPLSDGVDVGNYMGHMVLALEKLAHLEGFVRQADNLRQETLHQLRRILASRQAARCFVAIGEYYTRLRALSSLWASRPRQNLIGDGSVGSSTTDLHIVHPSMQDHFSGF